VPGGTVFHVGAQAICPHGGQVTTIVSSPRVKVSGQPAATLSDTYTVAGCTFMVAQKPQPCMSVKWLVPAVRVKAGGQPLILQTSQGLAQSADQIPAGPPTITTTQMRVSAT
jgi:hypothetical protein